MLHLMQHDGRDDQSFHDRMTEAVFRGRCPKGFPADLFKAARRRLIALDGATALDDLKIPTSNRLHPLTADRPGNTPSLSTISSGSASFGRTPDRSASSSRTTTEGGIHVGHHHARRSTAVLRRHRERHGPASAASGEVLREEFMVPLGLTAGAVAKALNLPRSRIERIVKEEIGISTDTALRLGRYFRTSHLFWLNLQTRFESETLLSEIGAELEGIQPVPEAA